MLFSLPAEVTHSADFHFMRLISGFIRKMYADSSSFIKLLTVSKTGKNSLFYLVNYISVKSNIATKFKNKGNH